MFLSLVSARSLQIYYNARVIVTPGLRPERTKSRPALCGLELGLERTLHFYSCISDRLLVWEYYKANKPWILKS